MNADCFLDTNILVYAATRTKSENIKRLLALELIEEKNFALSAQVLQEFYITVTRKLPIPLSPKKALEWIEQFEAFPCISLDSNLVKMGVEYSVNYQISYWDGAILAAAEISGARILYSEDFTDGQLYKSVRAINPFAHLTKET